MALAGRKGKGGRNRYEYRLAVLPAITREDAAESNGGSLRQWLSWGVFYGCKDFFCK